MYKGLIKAIRTNVLVGLVLATPLVITYVVVAWLFTGVTNLFIDFVPKSLRDAGTEIFVLRLISLMVVFVILFFIGVLIRNMLGKRLYRLGDRLLGRIPVINKIYVATRQVIEAIFTQRQTLFQEVVLLEYPRPGLYAVAFVTGIVPPEIRRLLDATAEEDYVTLFIPTTPNPTSGWLFVTPRSKVIPMNITTGDAMKLVISAGAVFPGNGKPEQEHSLLEKLDVWLNPHAKTDGKVDHGGEKTANPKG